MILLLCLFGASIDCPDLINFARGLNMHLVQPAKMTQMINFDCCDSVQNPTIGCTAARVSFISWSALQLNGTLNMTAFPSAATYIAMANNKISGNISVIPNRITNYYAENNRFSGVLPALPTSVDQMTFGNNLLTGTLPNFPPIIQYFSANGNAFTGSIPSIPASLATLSLAFNQLTQLPPSFPTLLTTIYLNNNLLVGSIPAPLLVPMLHLVVNNNQLSGTIPPLPSTLNTLRVYNNNFTGVLPTIPYDIRSIYIGPGNQLSGSVNVSRPSYVDLRDNYIFSLTIKDTSILVSCNLDNTALFGKVDALTMCSRLGLLSFTSNVPNTPTYSSTYKQGTISSFAISLASSPVGSPTNVQTMQNVQSATINQTTHNSYSSITASQNLSTTQYIQSLYNPETLYYDSKTSFTSTTSTSIEPTEYASSISSLVKQTTSKLLLQTSKLTLKSTKTTLKKSISVSNVFTSVSTIDIYNNTIAVQSITPFLVIRLLCDVFVFLYILNTITRLKKIRKHKREYVFTQSDYTQPSTSSSVH